MAPRLRPILPLLLLLAACAATSPSISPPPDASPAGSSSPTTTSTTDPTPVSAYPLTLTDDAGRSVTLDADPRRIVSLAPSNTEIVCAVASCDRLVGVTDFDDYPPEVADIDKVVAFAQVDVEKVVSTQPDLVLAAGNELTPTSVIDQLSALGLPVLVL